MMWTLRAMVWTLRATVWMLRMRRPGRDKPGVPDPARCPQWSLGLRPACPALGEPCRVLLNGTERAGGRGGGVIEVRGLEARGSARSVGWVIRRTPSIQIGVRLCALHRRVCGWEADGLVSGRRAALPARPPRLPLRKSSARLAAVRATAPGCPSTAPGYPCTMPGYPSTEPGSLAFFRPSPARSAMLGVSETAPGREVTLTLRRGECETGGGKMVAMVTGADGALTGAAQLLSCL
eukprot:1184881-Prorocentrum_minimum.AAC.1